MVSSRTAVKTVKILLILLVLFAWVFLAVVQDLLRLVLSYPLLLVVALLMQAILWGWLGKDYGVPNLFWHERRWVQFAAGVGVALLFGEVCFVAYMLTDPLEIESDTIRDIFSGYYGLGDLQQYLQSTWLPLVGLVVLAALIPSRRGDSRYRVPRWPMVLGLVVGVLAAAELGLAGYWAATALLAEVPVSTLAAAPEGLRQMSAEGRAFHALAAGLFGLLFLLYVLFCLTPLARLVSPALALCVLLGVVVAVYGFVTFWFPPVLQVPLLLIVLTLGVLANSLPKYKLRFPGLESAYRAPVVLDALAPAPSAPAVELLAIPAVLDTWRNRVSAAGAGDQPKLAVVAVSGGGIRAAVWTGVVLAELEKRLPAFPYHIRLITGASGGMLGAGYYVATLAEPSAGGHHNPDGSPLELERMVDNLAQDDLTPVARRLVFGDLPGFFWPGPLAGDRGRALEEAWEANTDQALAVPFAALAGGERAGWRPSLIFSPMIIENGRRLLISNLDLHFLTESRGSTLSEKEPRIDRYSLSALEFARLFPAADRLKLSTALRMSATFPWVSPAVNLPTDPPWRVVDAGYYDNYGVNLAAQWVHHHRRWLREHTSGVVLIQIRDSLSEERRRRLVVEDDERYWTWARGLEEFTAPGEGLFRARQAIMSFRNDEQVQVVNDLLNAEPHPPFFTTVVFECPAEVALSWYLTTEERDTIKAGMTTPVNTARLRLLNDWWRAGG
jgi:hypothetical protein